MPMKHKVEKIEDVAEPLRPFYEKGQGTDTAFYLQVEGMVPKTQLDDFRNNNIALMQERDQLKEKFKDVDPVKYAELIASAAKTPEAIEAAVQARVKQMRDEHNATLKERDTQIGTLSQQLNTVLVDGSLKSEAAKSGVLPTALDDVVLRGRMVFSTKDGKMIAKNERGEALYDTDGTSPLSIGTWLKDLKKAAPHLFQGMQGSGGQGNGGQGGGNGVDPSKMTPVQRIAYGMAHGGTGDPV